MACHAPGHHSSWKPEEPADRGYRCPSVRKDALNPPLCTRGRRSINYRLNEYRRLIMGDMKTPDFDDLLAAFDIPDMVDPKAAIESGHEEHDNHIKQNAQGDDEAHVPSSSDVGVSVIVKNVRTIEPSEASEKDSHHSTGNGLHNGFLTISNLERFNKEGLKSLKEKAMVSGNVQKDSVFNQFSPISSAEEFDDDEKIEVVDPPDRIDLTTDFGSSILAASNSRRPYERDKVVAHLMKSRNAVPSNGSKSKECQKELNALKVNELKVKKEEKLKDGAQRVLDGKVQPEKGEVNGESLSQLKLKSNAKFSSCIAAIAALSAKKVVFEPKDVKSNTEESSQVPKEVSDSPSANVKSPDVQVTVQNLIDGAKKTPVKPNDSPRSVSSENSSKGSPSSGGSTPAIPKVRIKTIKTSSGEIKRTVTRVLPDFETEGTKQPSDQSPSMVASPVLSSPTSAAAMLSSSSKASVQTSLATNPVASTDVPPKQVTIKPVATAFLPVSAVKTAGSQVINLKFGNNTTVKATVISAASVQSASNAIIKAANAIQQQTVVVPASSLANAKLVPKTVHFANLNLLPQGSQATTELRQVLTKPQQQIKQTLVPTTVMTPTKKVSRVQVLASSQSSVVEAFNKVLSSVNPVPVYIPNLSPPTNAGISLPARGYKCLECGDAFALEKSLLQHYDRRSVRIEVTCNHCTKSLVFYNKCSLLSHARGHKEKGVVMQCSHLILKPVPVDQMIASAQNGAPSTPTPQQSRAAVVAHTVAKVQPGASSPVISAPVSAPVTPAMPLDEDPSKLCRHSLKCLECNEAFSDETSLATHYQQVVDASGQKTCSVCMMLLPNQCSFACHQRVHQHKSPFTCPECGAICRSAHFQTHITKNCLHYTRRIGFRCIHCNVVYSEIAALKCHIQGSHCEVFYKCPICPMAFKSAPSTHTHAYTQHPGVKIGEPKIIYKCSMCDTVFTMQPLLYRHFDQHLEHQKVSVFKCPDCSLLYAQKQLMMDHIKSMHGTLKTVEGPPKVPGALPLSTKPTTQNSPIKEEPKPVNGTEKPEKKSVIPEKTTLQLVKEKLKSGWTCWDCEELFQQRDVYVAHMKKEHGKHMKKHPCGQCDKSFSSSHSLCRHTRIKHKGTRKVYTCPKCPETKRVFTKRVMLEKHIYLVHDGVKEPKVKTEVEETTEETSEVREDPQEPTPKRKLEEPALEFRPPRGAITQPLKKLKINVFKVHKCAVCGFTTENLLQFHEHIPQHKSDGSSYQCQECGLCYTSHVSLSRHLFIVHKLKEPQASSKQNGSGEDNQQENKPSVGNEAAHNVFSDKTCKVCSKTFETEATLNTHMRTHGMAFIKSKRMTSTEK